MSKMNANLSLYLVKTILNVLPNLFIENNIYDSKINENMFHDKSNDICLIP